MKQILQIYSDIFEDIDFEHLAKKKCTEWVVALCHILIHLFVCPFIHPDRRKILIFSSLYFLLFLKKNENQVLVLDGLFDLNMEKKSEGVKADSPGNNRSTLLDFYYRSAAFFSAL